MTLTLTTATLFGTYFASTADTNDAGREPELSPLSADVTFTPDIDRGLVEAAESAGVSIGLAAVPIPAKLVSGVLVDNLGVPDVTLHTFIERPLNYHVKFENVTYMGKPLPGGIKTFLFAMDAEEPRMNLVDAHPVTKTSEIGSASVAVFHAEQAIEAAINARDYASAAQTYSITASTGASTATSQAAAASASATAASSSQTAAKTSETKAKTSETNAKTSETNAKTSETNALAYRDTAGTHASTAITQTGIATTKAGEAETSAIAAQTARTGAETARDTAVEYRDTALAHKNAAATSETKAKTSETNAKASETAAKTSETNAKTSETNAKDSETSALAYRNTASTHATTAGTQAGIATTKAGESSTHADRAQTARTGAEDARTAAEGYRDTALSHKNAAATSATASADRAADALAHRNTAGTHATTATTQAGIATTGATTATTQAGIATTKAGEASDSAAAAQALHDDVAAAVAQFDVDFAADMALFTGIRDDINLVAIEVANDANRAEDAAQATEDALTVVRAHRWVPQGQWEYDLDYSAGDVVAHDGGSYYAQQDIAAGVEPPGGEWMMLGGGGITDAAELTGALTQFVDASGAVVDLGSYVPGVAPEFQAAQLAAILGHLYLSLESSVEASRVTGALTDQVDASTATVLIDYGNPGGPETVPVSGAFEMVQYMANAAHYAASTRAAAEHTHDGADISGVLTDAVDASAAMVGPTQYSPEPMSAAEWMDALESGIVTAIDMVNSKADVSHTHAVSDVTGLQSALDGKAPSSHTHTKAQVGLGNVDNTSDTNKPVSTATQAALDGKAATSHTHTKAQVGLGNVDNTADAAKPVSTATQTALNGKSDVGHTHPVTDLTATGTRSSSTYLRGDGTWTTPTNTTYSIPTQAEAEAGTATTARAFSAQRVRQAANAAIAENGRLAAAPATWHWAGTTLPTTISQVHAQARVGDYIVAPNLATDPGWHRITGV